MEVENNQVPFVPPQPMAVPFVPGQLLTPAISVPVAPIPAPQRNPAVKAPTVPVKPEAGKSVVEKGENLNEDGFVPGQDVNWKALQAFHAKKRKQPQSI